MPKLTKVEASVQTKQRAKTPSYSFFIYEEKSNETIFESKSYTERSNARRGARRYAKKNNLLISRWIK